MIQHHCTGGIRRRELLIQTFGCLSVSIELATRCFYSISPQPFLLDSHLQTHILAADESLASFLISHPFSSPMHHNTSPGVVLCLHNWSINCLRRLPFLHAPYFANIYMCQFNCVPISLSQIIYPLTHPHRKAPFVPRWLMGWLKWKCVYLGDNLTFFVFLLDNYVEGKKFTTCNQRPLCY